MIIFNLVDQRQIGDAGALTFNEEALQAAAEVAGLAASAPDDLVEIKIRLRDWNGEAAATVKGTSETSFRLVVYVKPKAEFHDKALYAINSIIVGMLRHIAQYRLYGPIVMEAKGMQDLMEEAHDYGRQARLTEQGKALWGVVEPETVEVPNE